ncbi:MAG TPA: ATP-binding protein [Candidatus Tectomicrobia bacterium]|nr:ATP-binding protein [Candidatus Tectomicrobia bacterium]
MMQELLASLRLRLWLLVFLAFMPAVGLIFYTASEQSGRAAQEVRDQALRMAQLVSSDHERRIDGTRYLLMALAHVPDLRDGDAATCEKFLSTFLKNNPLYTTFAMVDLGGNVICSSVPRDKPVNIADRGYFLNAIETRDFAVGEFHIGRITDKEGIGFGYPILDAEGHVQAVVAAGMDLSWLNQLVADAELPAGAVLTVIDRKATILARYPNPEPWVGQSGPSDPLFQAMLARGQGTVELRGDDGMPRIYAFTALRGLAGAGYVSIGIPQPIAYAPARRTLFRNLIGLGLVGVLALTAAWMGGDLFILRRVQALVQAAKRLSLGDWSTRTGLPHGRGELGQLAAAFDDMAESLEKQQTQRRLEEELRRQNEALAEENRRVQEVNRLKSEFVSLVSHELRTPLTAILGYLDLLGEEQSGRGAKPQELIGIVKRNTDRLVKLLDDLLDLSRIESGKIELNLTVVDVLALIAEVVSLLQPQIEAKGQQLTVNQVGALPPVQGDADRIRRILINLLSNAHKYTPPGGHIWVTAGAGAAWVRVDIRDDGIGLSPDEQARLFDRFFRARQPGTREVEGTGLGLPITRLLVERHGGQITVASAPGAGTTFSFTLPVAHMLHPSTPPP